jgi:ATP synthase F1 delta subunit
MSITKKVVASYSKSLFQNAKAISFGPIENFEIDQIIKLSSSNKEIGSTVYTIAEELTLIRSLFITSKKLQQFLQNPTYEEQQKLDFIISIFPGLSLTLKSFLKVLTERSHLNLLPEIEEEYKTLLLKFKNSTSVKLILASSLQESSGLIFLNKLRKITSSEEIFLNVSYNPKLLGGFIIEYNSVSIDASILREFSLFFNSF